MFLCISTSSRFQANEVKISTSYVCFLTSFILFCLCRWKLILFFIVSHSVLCFGSFSSLQGNRKDRMRREVRRAKRLEGRSRAKDQGPIWSSLEALTSNPCLFYYYYLKFIFQDNQYETGRDLGGNLYLRKHPNFLTYGTEMTPSVVQEYK